MTVVTLPAGILVNRQDFGKNNYDPTFTAGESGGSQTAVQGPPRLTCTLVSDDLIDADQAALWRSLIFATEGRANFVAISDLLNVAPRGTARGAWTASALAPAGASSLVILAGVAQAGKTLMVGDWIGVNQTGTNRQLLHIQAPATVAADGTLTVSFLPRLRIPVPAGSAVVWDKPTCLMRKNSDDTTWSSSGALQGGFNLDLLEQWF